MKMYEFACLILVALAYVQGAPNPRIVGGKDAPIAKYPHHISLRLFGSHTCGGSIINNNTILTAAHCIYGWEDWVKYFTVHAGTNLLNETGDKYEVANVSVHKDYDPYLFINDIALVHLKKPIIYSSKVKPILLSRNDTGLENKTCTLSGWGFTRPGSNIPNKLQEYDSIVYPQDKCKAVLWTIQDSHICTFIKKGQGACNGDSGGALLANGTQIGITSFVITGCAQGYPDVFTRVSSYANWIDAHLVK